MITQIRAQRQRLSMMGFSLVEAMVSVFIFSLLFAALLMVLSGGQAAWYTADVQTELNSELRKSLLTMNKELRQTKYTEISDMPLYDTFYTRITFKIPECQGLDKDLPDCSVVDSSGSITWSINITYSLNADNQIIRNPPLGSIPFLANNISSLQFRRLSTAPDIIEIYITAQKNTVWRRNLQANIMSSVKMRN